MRQRMKEIRRSSCSIPSESVQGEGEEDEPQSDGSLSDGGLPRHPRRGRRHNFNDFTVDISEFEGELDLKEFLEWMQTVERIFEYKEISEDKKVKLVALKLRKYASLWWTNLLTKRVRQGKGKIRTWEKMKIKLKARFLPSTYIQKQLLLTAPLNLRNNECIGVH